MDREDARRLFAAYEPHPPPRLAAAASWVRPVALEDADAVAALIADREGESIHEVRERLLAGWIPPAEGRALFVAGSEPARGRVLAYARAAQFEPPADAPQNAAPRGLYLAGVIVDPGARRRGLGRALTEARLSWVAERGGEAFFFCNAQNRASIDLHQRLGFVELTRNFWYPGASFVGGEGILFQLRRDR